DVESLLQRYQAEKGMSAGQMDVATPATNGTRRGTLPDLRLAGGSKETSPRTGPARAGLPALTTAANAEVEKLRAENAELRQLVNEYREVLEANDPTVWEQKVAHAEQQVAEKDEQIAVFKQKVDEWNEKFKTHRFVPHDDELAQT